jgi:hypothetical protein
MTAEEVLVCPIAFDASEAIVVFVVLVDNLDTEEVGLSNQTNLVHN